MDDLLAYYVAEDAHEASKRQSKANADEAVRAATKVADDKLIALQADFDRQANYLEEAKGDTKDYLLSQEALKMRQDLQEAHADRLAPSHSVLTVTEWRKMDTKERRDFYNHSDLHKSAVTELTNQDIAGNLEFSVMVDGAIKLNHNKADFRAAEQKPLPNPQTAIEFATLQTEDRVRYAKAHPLQAGTFAREHASIMQYTAPKQRDSAMSLNKHQSNK